MILKRALNRIASMISARHRTRLFSLVIVPAGGRAQNCTSLFQEIKSAIGLSCASVLARRTSAQCPTSSHYYEKIHWVNFHDHEQPMIVECARYWEPPNRLDAFKLDSELCSTVPIAKDALKSVRVFPKWRKCMHVKVLYRKFKEIPVNVDVLHFSRAITPRAIDHNSLHKHERCEYLIDTVLKFARTLCLCRD